MTMASDGIQSIMQAEQQAQARVDEARVQARERVAVATSQAQERLDSERETSGAFLKKQVDMAIQEARVNTQRDREREMKALEKRMASASQRVDEAVRHVVGVLTDQS